MTKEFNLEPRVWALADPEHPEEGLAHRSPKRLFWSGSNSRATTVYPHYLDVQIDRNAELIYARREANPCAHKPVREGDPNENYDPTLSANMDHRTPQFNLRNVMRLIRESDMENMEWGGHEIPDRRGFEEDLEEVRSARHSSPSFESNSYASMALVENQATAREFFVENDWEQWYGEDKKRLAGSLWGYVPPDGGKRTRPFPKDMLVTPHKYWKGRLITEDY